MPLSLIIIIFFSVMKGYNGLITAVITNEDYERDRTV